jgi:hypothetical protein
VLKKLLQKKKEPKGDRFIMAFGSKETGKLFLPEDGS